MISFYDWAPTQQTGSSGKWAGCVEVAIRGLWESCSELPGIHAACGHLEAVEVMTAGCRNGNGHAEEDRARQRIMLEVRHDLLHATSLGVSRGCSGKLRWLERAVHLGHN